MYTCWLTSCGSAMLKYACLFIIFVINAKLFSNEPQSMIWLFDITSFIAIATKFIDRTLLICLYVISGIEAGHLNFHMTFTHKYDVNAHFDPYMWRCMKSKLIKRYLNGVIKVSSIFCSISPRWCVSPKYNTSASCNILSYTYRSKHSVTTIYNVSVLWPPVSPLVGVVAGALC